VLLLRRAVAALRQGGGEVTLLAPAAAGAAVIGPGPSEAQSLIDWERADVASLLGDGAPGARLGRELAGHALVVAVTRNAALLRQLRAAVPRVLARDPEPAAGVHAARWYADALAERGVEPTLVPPPLQATAAEQRQAQAWLDRLPRGFLAVHPGSGATRKNWPAERFLALVESLSMPTPWLLVAGPADGGSTAPFRARRDVVVAQDVPVRVLGRVLGAAGVFVGNDSGVSHLAAAWDAPTVALFGPTDARVWAPDGRRVRCVSAAAGEMTGLTLDEVRKAVEATRLPCPS
jgi:hypothetical protein